MKIEPKAEDRIFLITPDGCYRVTITNIGLIRRVIVDLYGSPPNKNYSAHIKKGRGITQWIIRKK